MVFSHAYRVLLIGLLPVVALLMYYEGQNYDPALIRFQESPSTKISTSAFFPDEIAGHIQTGPLRSYTKDNLYEYVNGHAEYFISSGFAGLTVGEYGAAEKSEAEPDVVVDVYDMGKSIQAFGILSDESGGNVSDLQNGLTGFRTPQGVSFIKGQYYIRIASFNDDVSLNAFTERISSAVGSGQDPFPEFSRLPDLGDVVATRFIKEDHRGLDFVENVIEREYVKDGNTVQVFIVISDNKGTDSLTGKFVDHFDRSEMQYSLDEQKGKKVYRIKDPYEGDWVLIFSPDTLSGILGSFDENMINKLLTE